MQPLTQNEIVALAKRILTVFRGRYPPGVLPEDALHDAVLGLLEQQSKYPASSSISPDAWLITRVRGRLRDAYGKLWKKEYAHSAPQTPDEYTLDPIAGDNPETQDLRADLTEALNRLPKREAQVIRLTMSGMTQPQIATKMGVSQSYVSQLLKRARENLRALLGEDYL